MITGEKSQKEKEELVGVSWKAVWEVKHKNAGYCKVLPCSKESKNLSECLKTRAHNGACVQINKIPSIPCLCEL